jgi:hypothetical protein
MLSVTESGTIERSRIVEKTNRGRAVVKERIRFAAMYIPSVQDRIACGSKEFDPLSHFPEGKAGAGMVPPTLQLVLQLPPQEGPTQGSAPLRDPPSRNHSPCGSPLVGNERNDWPPRRP